MMDILIKTKEKKLKLINFLNKNNIESRIFYPPIHRLSIYKKSDKKFPVTTNISDRGLWLPSSVTLKEGDVIKISNLIKKFFQ
jgi:dTDP-4-amino-4,6-dideoxygalactose transaminase